MATIKYWNGSAWELAIVGKQGPSGFVAQTDAPTDTSVLWLDTDEPSVSGIPATIINAKGDLIVGSAADTPAILSVAADGSTIVADSAATTGLRWQGNYAAGKNKIINGDMVIDQRNSASSAVTVNSNASFYATDRWSGFGQAADGVYTLAQDSSAPAGFTKSLKATVTTADTSIASTQSYTVSQRIEGFNVADLDFGLSSAKTITVSFWVRSSLTGTFGAALRNNAVDRSYPYSYTISTADTWEKKTVTIAGDTTGTWLKDSGIGLRIDFSLGAGTDRVGTAGAWNGNNNLGVTGQTQVIGTLNATWYVTGVQVEIGNVGTAFQTATGTIQGEFDACRRYYQRFNNTQTYQNFGLMRATSTTVGYLNMPLQTPMRTAPSTIDFSTLGWWAAGPVTAISNATLLSNYQSPYQTFIEITTTGITSGTYYNIFGNASTSAYIGFGAEL